MMKLITFIIVCLCFTSGCHGNVDKDTEAKLINKAEVIMENMQHQRFLQVMDEGAAFFKIQTNAKELEQAWSQIPDVYGDYIGIDRTTITKIKEGYRIVMVVNFENYKAQYTMAFDDDLKLIGIFFK